MATPLYGTGYGLAKMLEGATGGALRGQAVAREREMQESAEQRAERGLGIQEERLDIAKQQVESQAEKDQRAADQAAMKRSMDIFSKSFEAGKAAPVGSRRKVYEAVHKSLDPEGIIPPVEFDQTGESAKVTLEDGTVLAGPAARLSEVATLISRDPGRAEETIRTALETGVVRIEKFAPAEKETQLKPADYSRGIADIFKKYNAGGLINVLPDGTIDMQSLLSGKQSAYQIIQQKAQQGDAAATRDLELLDEYYGQVESMLRPNRALVAPGGQPPATPRPAPGAAPATGETPMYEATATNPQTGERVGLVNGQWQPIPQQ